MKTIAKHTNRHPVLRDLDIRPVIPPIDNQGDNVQGYMYCNVSVFAFHK